MCLSIKKHIFSKKTKNTLKYEFYAKFTNFKLHYNLNIMSKTPWKNISFHTEEHIGILTLNRPHKMNALNGETLNEISSLLDRVEKDESCWGLIITGAGEKAFVAGADISEFVGKSQKKGKELAFTGQESVFDKIENFPKPILAAINGYALGGGLELALACHLRYASSQAKMGFPEVSLGLIPGYGGTQRLPALIGKGKAMEMILTGEAVSAEEALRWGLVNKVTETESLLEESKKCLQKMFRNSRHALSKAIRAINAYNMPDKKGYRIEIESFGELFSSSDFEEGVSAFLEKRKARFK